MKTSLVKYPSEWYRKHLVQSWLTKGHPAKYIRIYIYIWASICNFDSSVNFLTVLATTLKLNMLTEVCKVWKVALGLLFLVISLSTAIFDIWVKFGNLWIFSALNNLAHCTMMDYKLFENGHITLSRLMQNSDWFF